MLSIFAITVPGFLIGAFVMALSSRRAPPGAMSQRWLKLVVFFLIVHGVLGVAMLGSGWVTALMAIVLTGGAFEMHRAWGSMKAPRPVALWPVFVSVVAIVIIVARGLPGATFAFLFLVTAATDGFSQVVGQLVGRHKLAPRISPAKTIEGLLGGLVAAFVVGLLVRPMLLHWSVLATLGLTLATALAGLAGDLAASWVKRRARIKDYSAALPGQGGFLDRFDSLLGAMTTVGLALVGPL